MAASRRSAAPGAQDRKSMFAFEDPTNSLSLIATIDLLEVRLRASADAGG